MPRPWTAGLGPALVVLAVAAPGAAAATQCVGPPGCPTLAEALSTAEANGQPDVIRMAAGQIWAPGAHYTSDEPLELSGAGPEETTVVGPLRLEGARIALHHTAIRAGGGDVGLAASGHVHHVRILGAALAVAIRALPAAPLRLEDVLVATTGTGVALDAPCNATLRARHVTVAGDGRDGARAGCDTAAVELDSSVVARSYEAGLRTADAGSARATYSSLPPGNGTVTQPIAGAPRLDAAGRPEPGSPVIEAGAPDPLAVGVPEASEQWEDLGGDVRIADGDGNGIARRDAGAFEAGPPRLELPPGNLLENPDAESGPAGAPEGWTTTGGFTTAEYGSGVFPTARTGLALGAGLRFFAGGDQGDAAALQVVDVTAQAASIDAGTARATLSGLLGGYRADADVPTVHAAFRGPSGVVLGTLGLGPVDAAARGNATNLLARSASVAVPAFTRDIAVMLRAAKGAGGTYDDAYFDKLGLRLDVPSAGEPPGGPPGDPGGVPGPQPRPFSGVIVFTRSASLSRRGTSRLLVGCASATVARCTGDLRLAAVLVRGTPRVSVGRAKVSLAPGSTARIAVRLSARARSYLRRHTRLRVRVATTAVDGQGVRRATTVPIVLRPARRPEGRSGRH
jgi:hypothetical protein